MIPQRRVYLEHDKPEFIEDFIYTPPYAMMEKALTVNQEGFNNAVTEASLYGSIPIDYIKESPAAKAEAIKLMDYYAKQGEQINNAISQDPMNWRKQGMALNSLRNQLSKDFQTGRLSELRQSKANYDKVMTHLSSLDPTIRDAAQKQLMEEYEAGVSQGKLFQDKTYLNRIDLQKKFVDEIVGKLGSTTNNDVRTLVGNMKEASDKGEIGTVYGYMRELTTGTISNVEQVKAALNAFINEPGNRAYMRQMQNLGLENYFKKDTDELLPWDDPTNSLTGLKDIAESRMNTTTTTGSTYTPDSYVMHKEQMAQSERHFNAQMAENRRQFNAQMAEKTVPEQQRGGNFKLALTGQEQQQLLNDNINKIVNDNVFGLVMREDYKGKLKGMKLLDKKAESISGALDTAIERLSEYSPNGPAVKHLKSLRDNLHSTVKTVIESTDQSWAGYSETDPTKRFQKRKAFNDAFTIGSQTKFNVPVSNNNNGIEASSQQLQSISHQVGRSINGYLMGVPGTEFTEEGNTMYSEYYPAIGKIGYNPQTGTATLATPENYKTLRAATFTPSDSEEALPTSDEFIKVNIRGKEEEIPQTGVGVLSVNLIGYQKVKDKGYVMTTVPTTSIYTTFQTSGEGSIR